MAWCKYNIINIQYTYNAHTKFQTIFIQFVLYRAKGVKVDLGIPHEMWDKPPAEVTQLKTQVGNSYITCETSKMYC